MSHVYYIYILPGDDAPHMIFHSATNVHILLSDNFPWQ